MKHTPLVSVLIITMNHNRFIEQSCKSVFNQSYDNIEIILLDNNSSDNTFEIAQEMFKKCKFPHQLLKNNAPLGVAKNLNILASKATGEYISILSGDDWYTHDAVESKVAFFQENNVDFALSDGYIFYQDENKTTDAYPAKKKQNIIKNLHSFFKENVAHNQTINVGTFVKKDILKEFPFDEKVNTEDWDMNLRLVFKGFKIGFIDKKLFYYRILSNSLSRNWRLMEQSYKIVTEKYIDYIKSNSSVSKKYQLMLLYFQYEIALSETHSKAERKQLEMNYKKSKYKIKYKQPYLFLKLLFLNSSGTSEL